MLIFYSCVFSDTQNTLKYSELVYSFQYIIFLSGDHRASLRRLWLIICSRWAFVASPSHQLLESPFGTSGAAPPDLTNYITVLRIVGKVLVKLLVISK